MRLLFGLWLLAVGVGFHVLLEYGSAPGALEPPQARWPSASTIVPAPGLPTLVVALHPHCFCSRATLDSLARLMTCCRGKLEAHVLVLRPRAFPAGWERTDLWRDAAAIPGVTVRADVDGREAAWFGAATSGHTVLYSAAGRRLYHGGITLARGHLGANPGLEAVRLGVLEGRAEAATWPVFGCPLRHEEDEGS